MGFNALSPKDEVVGAANEIKGTVELSLCLTIPQYERILGQFLVHSTEVVLPIGLEILSLRMLLELKL